jgi:hypothetical protein
VNQTALSEIENPVRGARRSDFRTRCVGRGGGGVYRAGIRNHGVNQTAPSEIENPVRSGSLNLAGAMLAVLAALAGCGGPQPRAPSPTPIDAGADAAPVDAAPPAPVDPATAELLAALREQRDRACACTDAACGEDAEALAVQWGLDHPDVVRAARPTPDQQRELAALIEAAEACLERWHEDEHGHRHGP